MTKNNQKFVIVLILILLILTSIIAIFVSLNIKDDNDDSNTPNSHIPSSEPIINKEISRLKDTDEYFAVQSAINSFYDKVSANEKSEIVSLLDSNYVIENNITNDNVFEKMNLSTSFINFIVEEIYYNDNSNITYYFVKGYENEYLMGEDEYVKYNKNLFYLLVVDTNKHYVIKPLNNVNNLEEFANNYDINVVTINNDSKFKKREITEEKKVTSYITNYTNLIYSDSDKAYKMLDDNTKKNYLNLDSFINDIDNISDRLFIKIWSINTQENEDNIVYKVQNHNGDTITITEYYPNDYKIGFNFIEGE